MPGAAAPLPFDPRTGEYLPPPGSPPPFDPEAPRRGGWATAWTVILGIDLGLLAALLGLGFVAYLLGEPVAQEVPSWALWLNGALNLVLMGAIPFAWVVATRVGGLHGAMHYLKLERPLDSIGKGLLLGVAALLAVVLLASLLAGAGVPSENPQLESIGQAMTVPLAVFTALSAALGEEILFRGVLQRWVGWVAQGVLFGLLHASYGVPLQIVIPLVIGLAFGYLVHRGMRLWVAIVAHFTYDMAVLLLVMAEARGWFG